MQARTIVAALLRPRCAAPVLLRLVDLDLPEHTYPCLIEAGKLRG